VADNGDTIPPCLSLGLGVALLILTLTTYVTGRMHLGTWRWPLALTIG